MKNSIVSYFKRPSELTFGSRFVLVVLGIVLFLSLAAFGPILALHKTALDPDYVASQVVDEIDIYSIAHDWLGKNIAPNRPHLAKAIELGILNLEPKIREQLHSDVSYMYALILERLEKGKLMDMVVSQQPLVVDVATNIETALGLPVLAPVFDSLGIDLASIQGYVNVSEINAYFDVLKQVAQARYAFIAVKNSYIPLIVVMLLLVVGIVFIAREVRFTTRELGITFTTYGVFQCLGAFLGKGYVTSALLQYDAPQLLRDLLQRMIGDFTTVLAVFSLSLLFCGVVLLVVSFVYKPRQLASPNGS